MEWEMSDPLEMVAIKALGDRKVSRLRVIVVPDFLGIRTLYFVPSLKGASHWGWLHTEKIELSEVEYGDSRAILASFLFDQQESSFRIWNKCDKIFVNQPLSLRLDPACHFDVIAHPNCDMWIYLDYHGNLDGVTAIPK